MSSLLLTLIFGQLLVPGQAGPTDGLILGNPAGASAPAFLDTFARTGVLPCDDPNTVACVTWLPDGGGLYDSKGNSWTENGTVPQVTGSTSSPLYPNGYAAAPMAGAGPYSTSNYYSAAYQVGSDSAAFTNCIAYLPSASDSSVLAQSGSADLSHGWMVEESTSSRVNFYYGTGSAHAALSPTSTQTPGAAILFCWGSDGDDGVFAELNLGAVASTSATYAPGNSGLTYLGRYYGGDSAFSSGTLLGFWSSNTPASATSLPAIESKFFGLVADTGQELSFSRASAATGVIDGHEWTWAAGVPRIGPFDGGTGAFIEGASTNLALYSEQFDNSIWSTANTTVTANQAVAPDGNTTADQLQTTASNGAATQSFTSSNSAASSYTVSAWIRSVSGTQTTALRLWDGTAASQICADTTTATTSWRRYSCTGTAPANHTLQIIIYPGGFGGSGSVYAWGAMAEALPSETSYIATAGTVASRLADVMGVTNPLRGGQPLCQSATFAPADTWGNSASVLLATGAGTGAGESLLWLDGTSLAFRVVDSTGALKEIQAPNFADTTYWDNSSGHTITGCDSAGNLSLYIDGIQAPNTILLGTGTGIYGPPATTVYVGERAGVANFSAGQFAGSAICVGSAPGRCLIGPRGEWDAALGDSITVGTVGGATASYAQVLQRLYPLYHRNDNFGVTGDATPDMVTRWESTIRHHGYTRLLLMGGVNDLKDSTGTSASVWANLKQIYDEALSDGMKVTAFTILPWRGYGSWTDGGYQATLAVNQNILAYDGGSNFVAVDAYSAFDDGTGAIKSEYIDDAGNSLHPNQAGNDELAALAKAAAP